MEIDVRLKQFCFQDADCLVVVEIQCSSWGWPGNDHPNLESDSQTMIHTSAGTILIIVSLMNVFASNANSRIEPAWQRYPKLVRAKQLSF